MFAAIPGLQVSRDVSLADYTRFGIGGPAAILAETAGAESFIAALRAARGSGHPTVVIGGGTNLIASDEGFPGIVLRFTANSIRAEGSIVTADAGADLQALVDFSVERGLKGLETLAGIPGWVGGAVYGNAGAFGHSISERITSIAFTDGETVRSLTNQECEFHYRESIFKRRKDWVVLSATLALEPADAGELRETAAGIERVRDEKFPRTMQCAGSIFKNLILAELPPAVAAQVPPSVVREGKVPAAWFLEQAGAKGKSLGAIRVADYHANLIYNTGGGTSRDLRALIRELKSRVGRRFGLELEEEVQILGSRRQGTPAACPYKTNEK
jgi:UDP-N-acetylmuramate dehydrogenase